jgi:hypothetical protein
MYHFFQSLRVYYLNYLDIGDCIILIQILYYIEFIHVIQIYKDIIVQLRFFLFLISLLYLH